MASIRKEILLDARAEDVWDAVRDIGALHIRLVPGFVTDTRLEEGARIVTFGNGMVVRELIVDLDDQARRRHPRHDGAGRGGHEEGVREAMTHPLVTRAVRSRTRASG